MAARLTPRRGAAGSPRRAPRSTLFGVALLATVGLALAACAPGAHRGPTYPPEGVTPPPVTGQTDTARAAVAAALASAGFQATVPDQPYRPAEGAWFASAPRTVVEVQVPGETSPRFVVLYAFDNPADAAAAAADQATYVTRGAGAVSFPQDSRFTIRTLGSVAIFFTWSPSNGDPRTMDVETALDTVGSEVPLPH